MRKKVKVNAQTPFEIGDYVRFDKSNKSHTMQITDIIAKTSVKTRETTFILELDGWYMLDLKLHDVKIDSVEHYKPQEH